MCFCVCSPSPRWRSLCWGCRPGLSEYAAAGRDALLNSRDRKMSRAGTGMAIVLQRITSRRKTHAIYTKQQAHADVNTQVCIQYTHTHTQQYTSRDNELRHNKGGVLDCSSVAVTFHCCWKKRDFRESYQHFHIQYILYMDTRQKTNKCTQTCHSMNEWYNDLKITFSSLSVWRSAALKNTQYRNDDKPMSWMFTCWSFTLYKVVFWP